MGFEETAEQDSGAKYMVRYGWLVKRCLCFGKACDRSEIYLGTDYGELGLDCNHA